MYSNQEKILKHIMRFFANHLIDRMRSIHNWEAVYYPSDPEDCTFAGLGYMERKVDYYYLDFIYYNLERRMCPTQVGEVLIPSLKLRLIHRPTDIISPYKEVIDPYVRILKTICPNHLEPHKYFQGCQHECFFGWMLRDTHSPFEASPIGYRLNTREGYKFEHGQLALGLLEACTVRTMKDATLRWEDIAAERNHHDTKTVKGNTLTHT